MKKGYKHKTGMFGSDAEHYVSRLLHLLKHPNGDRRPDLVSINGDYNPILSVEVKSGRKKKGILVDYQLHYAVTTEQAYVELFGEKPPIREIKTELFPSIQTASRLIPGNPVAYYYCLIDRVDELKASDLDRPFSSIKCEWGDIFFVPPEFAFYSFVACRVKRSGEEMEKVVKDLREMVRTDSISWSSENYDQRKGHTYSWQNLHGRDILALFKNNLDFATTNGKERIDLISRFWPEVHDLARVSIEGPNQTKIYAMVIKEDYELFDSQMRKIISEKKPILERVSRSRSRAEHLLNKLPIYEESELIFEDSTGKLRGKTAKILTQKEIKTLERLVRWLDNGEKEHSLNPF